MKTIREARNSKGYTQMQLSEKTGLTQVAISRMERGETTPHPSTKMKIEKVLKARIDWQDSEQLMESMILSDWLECQSLFRLLVQKINGLVERKERDEFLNMAGSYIRQMKQSNKHEKTTEACTN